MRLIVGISGASGAVLGVRLLEALREQAVETHLVISRWGQQTIVQETGRTLDSVRALASHHYATGDLGAAVASGSFVTEGMAVVPCSMRSVAAIAHGLSDNLLHRAAEVALKEKRRLVVVPRETPLSAVHLENLLKLAQLGITVLPPMPAFYSHPETLGDIVDQVVARILDQFGIAADFARRWDGAPQKDRVLPLRRRDEHS